MRHQQKHVLLVDDCEDVLFIHASLLKKLGYCVTAVTDGQQALNTFMDNRELFSIIISDYQMPKMDGVELIKSIRLYDKAIPILIISGRIESFLAEDVSDTAVQVASKPLSLNLFTNLIDQMLYKQGG